MPAASRIVPDTIALKALTHPDRLTMLGILRLEGPQTATGLARRLGLNSGATSYHLRQLARHGFIATDPARGNRRERWWMAIHHATTLEPASADGAHRDATLAFMQAVVSQHATSLQRAHEAFPDLPADWQQAQTISDLTIPTSAADARALMDAIGALLWRARQAAPAPGAPLPEGWRPFTIQLHGFPHMPAPPSGTPQ